MPVRDVVEHPAGAPEPAGDLRHDGQPCGGHRGERGGPPVRPAQLLQQLDGWRRAQLVGDKPGGAQGTLTCRGSGGYACPLLLFDDVMMAIAALLYGSAADYPRIASLDRLVLGPRLVTDTALCTRALRYSTD
jgi:hypothetical protein